MVLHGLIPVSSQSIRKKWLTLYHEIEKKLAKTKREWNRFENESHTAYQHWYHETFAKLLSEIQEVSQKLHEVQVILSAVEEHIKMNGLTKKAALEFVLNAIENKNDPFVNEEERAKYKLHQKKNFENEFKQQHQSYLNEEIEELDLDILEQSKKIVREAILKKYPSPPSNPFDAIMLNELINDAIHDVYEKLKKNEPIENENEDEPIETVEIDNNDDYKFIYRKIVKKLHPDRGTEMSKDEQKIWTEAQIAYRQKNKEALQTLLLRIEGDGQIQIHLIESIGDLIDIVQSLQNELNEMSKYQSRSKKLPVYRFWASQTRPKNRSKIKSEIYSELTCQLHYSKMELGELESDLRQLKRSSFKKSKPTLPGA